MLSTSASICARCAGVYGRAAERGALPSCGRAASTGVTVMRCLRSQRDASSLADSTPIEPVIVPGCATILSAAVAIR